MLSTRPGAHCKHAIGYQEINNVSDDVAGD
jgi:hypothetical protein